MSDLLNQASLVYIPSGYKEDKAYSVIPTDGSGDLTFTRASDGTRVNSQGLVERVPWNLVQYSNTFSNPAWVKSSCTFTSGQNDPNGGTNGWRYLTSVAASGYAYQNGVLQNGVQYTFYIYAKSNTGSTQTMYFTANSGSFISPAFTLTSSWQLCSWTFTANSTGEILFGYNPSATLDLLVYGAQLNEGSTAKPYFPTTDRLNVPRLDYSNGCPSLLLEPQRTNLVTYSQNFSMWTAIGSPTVTSNYGTSPSGIQNSTRIQGVSGDRIYLAISGTSATYTYSIYAKGSGTFKLRENTDTYNLGITPTSNWVRYDFSFTAAFTNIQIQLTSTCDIEIWGAQLEAGSYPTSYIGPTTSASVTRVADAASKTGISSLIGQTEGTMFFDGTAKADTELCDLGRSTINSIFLYTRPDNSVAAFVYADGTGVNLISTISASNRFKAAVAYKTNSIVFYVNGSLVHQNTTATFTPNITLDRFDIAAGGYVSSKQSVTTNQALLFKTRLTNAELAALTTL
jgi:hypothetical protein